MKRGWVVLAVVGIVLANRFAEAESVATAPAVAYHLSNAHAAVFLGRYGLFSRRLGDGLG